jgi:hypothetical protein
LRDRKTLKFKLFRQMSISRKTIVPVRLLQQQGQRPRGQSVHNHLSQGYRKRAATNNGTKRIPHSQRGTRQRR